MIAGKRAWLNKAGSTVVGPGKDWVTVQMTRAQARRRGLMAEPVPLAA